MSRDYLLQVEDILVATDRIKGYVQGMSYDEFRADIKTQDAVVRNLQVIGEAVRGLPDELKTGEPLVNWRGIIGLRNVLVHEYFGINLPIIWDVISNKLDDLEAGCKRLMKKATQL
jgi:uncharacterized protein with HEPN domain